MNDLPGWTYVAGCTVGLLLAVWNFFSLARKYRQEADERAEWERAVGEVLARLKAGELVRLLAEVDRNEVHYGVFAEAWERYNSPLLRQLTRAFLPGGED